MQLTGKYLCIICATRKPFAKLLQLQAELEVLAPAGTVDFCIDLSRLCTSIRVSPAKVGH